ncbi:LPS export ABC transporter periplasmic protein LptC [uncultured Thiohalocapsa sp.]|uniref:LPS export ABC transporter periplasmic protein LptC n=1 Tax=uncultured Thiohalocapsa sp. TaxID=768990 RepID=UPI0025EC0BCB|nr:LPS export ABC transporter periplasmic protein LptC [uncultured Thiohalocapsa sp.]
MTLSAREVMIALLLAAAGLAAWWYRGAQAPPAAPMVPQHGRPDYVVEQVAAVTMSEDGIPARRLRAPQLRRYPGTTGSELDAPVLRLLKPGEPDWVIRAEQAWVSAAGDEVLLEGRVAADRAAAADAPAMRILTSELLVIDAADYAETDRFVELERGEDWLTAVDGMQLWYAAPMRSRFFGRVRQRLAVAAADQASGAGAP